MNHMNGISWMFYKKPIVRPGTAIVLKITDTQYSVFGHQDLTITQQLTAINRFIKKAQEQEDKKK